MKNWDNIKLVEINVKSGDVSECVCDAWVGRWFQLSNEKGCK